MKLGLLVALGGAVGTLLRHGVSLVVVSHPHANWPFGTFIVNVVGSFALGVVAETCAGRTLLGQDLRIVLGTGLMGGFTTYSSFNLETLRLANEGQLGRSAVYVAATLVCCLIAGIGGLALGRLARAA